MSILSLSARWDLDLAKQKDRKMKRRRKRTDSTNVQLTKRSRLNVPKILVNLLMMMRRESTNTRHTNRV